MTDLSSFTPDPKLEQQLEQFASKVVSLRLETPVCFLLEAHKPLTSLLHTSTLLLSPVATPLFGTERIDTWQKLLADRRNVDRLQELIEVTSENQKKEKAQT